MTCSLCSEKERSAELSQTFDLKVEAASAVGLDLAWHDSPRLIARTGLGLALGLWYRLSRSQQGQFWLVIWLAIRMFYGLT